jgi:hypothetical protein
MKDIVIYTIWLLCSFSLIAVSAAMAIKGVSGWGWFLFAGIMFLMRFSYGDKKNTEDKQKEVNNDQTD